MLTSDFGLMWPTSDGDDVGRRVSRMAIAKMAASRIYKLAPGGRECVQAGGHIGLWPRELATRFRTVYTFEPDATNWACLVRNVTAPNVFATRGVLGAIPGCVSLERSKEKSGLWKTVKGGPIPTYTIDAMGLTELDALVLDVEGDELKVLHGAERTIQRCYPVVWFEARTADAVHAIAWLRNRGYELPQRTIGKDVVMVAA